MLAPRTFSFLVDSDRLGWYTISMKTFDKPKTCAITGRRPKGFTWDYADDEIKTKYRTLLQAAVERLIQEGVTRFVTGGALGVDLDVAEIVLQLQKKYPFVTHLLVLPYEKQGGRYASIDKIRHERVQQLSTVVCLSEDFTPWCMQQRNEYMVDNADLVAAFVCGEKTGGTYNTIRHAKKKGKSVYIFDLATCPTASADGWYDTAKSHAVEQLKLI